MSEDTKPQTQDENDFFDRPSTIKWILRIFYSLCILLVLFDFAVHRHIETSIEKIPAFYAIYGFVACVILVLIATQMRKWLMRDEYYYEDTRPLEEREEQ
jgi:hypothetical protein